MKNKKKKDPQSKKSAYCGMSILEALIAVFIAGIIIPTFFVVLANLLSAGFNNRDSVKAANLAQEGIEVARNRRDQNWKSNKNAFDTSGVGGVFPSDGNYCLDANYNNNCVPVLSKFNRTINISSTDGGTTRTITCTVTWNLSGGVGVGTASLTDKLYQWANAD